MSSNKKCLRCGKPLRKIGLERKNGRPFINLSNRVQKYLKKKTPSGYKTVVNVSISDEKDYVISNVIISLQKK